MAEPIFADYLAEQDAAEPSFADFLEEKPKPQRGAFAEIGRQIGAGAVVDLPRMGGQALQAITPEGSPASEFGKEIAAAAELRAAGWEPDLQGRNPVSEAFIKGGRAIAPSLATMAAYLVPGGVVLGPAATVALFGGSQYQEEYDKVKAAGGTDEDAKNAGLITGAIQGGGEAIANKLSFGLFGAGKKAAIAGIEGLAGRATDTAVLKPFVKSAVKVTGAESATEILQDTGTAAVEREYGLPTDSMASIAYESGTTAAAMTLLLAPLGLAGHYKNAKRAQAIDHLLSDPNAPKADRTAVVDMLYADATKADIPGAETWKTGAMTDIENKRPIRREAEPIIIPPSPDKTTGNIPADIGVTDPAVTVDQAIEKAAAIVDSPSIVTPEALDAAIDAETPSEVAKVVAPLAGVEPTIEAKLDEVAGPTVETIHALADSKGIPWDNDPDFMALTKEVTGKEHLDDLTPAERLVLSQRLQSEPDRFTKPAAEVVKPVEKPTVVETKPEPITPAKAEAAKLIETRTAKRERIAAEKAKLQGEPELVLPRHELPEEQNQNLLDRAMHLKARIPALEDLGKRGVDLPGSENRPGNEKGGYSSGSPAYWGDWTSGHLDRDQIITAVDKIISDKGADVDKGNGVAVARLKELLLTDRQFEEEYTGQVSERKAKYNPAQTTMDEKLGVEAQPTPAVKAEKPAPEKQAELFSDKETIQPLTKPIVGREVSPETAETEAPLFSKAAKEEKPEQAKLQLEKSKATPEVFAKFTPLFEQMGIPSEQRPTFEQARDAYARILAKGNPDQQTFQDATVGLAQRTKAKADTVAEATKPYQPRDEAGRWKAIPAGVTVNMKAIRASTGEEFTVQEEAQVAVRDLNDSLTRYRKLLECLR